MDPISVTASVVAIIGLAETIITVCKAYVNGVKDAPKDLRSILIEVGSVKCALETLRMCPELLPLFQQEGSESPLEGCDQALKQLHELLPKEPKRSGQKRRGKHVVSYSDLMWPFKESKAREALERLGRHKAAIILLLTTDAGQDLKSIKNATEEIKQKLSAQERDLILKWLVGADSDPSSNHNRAAQLHEPDTCKWMLRSEEFKNLLAGSIRFLWLHGIPGAGKTVLASYIIENIQNFCNNASATGNTGWCYYYCYYEHHQDESLPLLRRVIAQLCKQLKDVPEKLYWLYDSGVEIRREDLLDVLSELTTRFRHVYMVVDALDESEDRQRFLDSIIKLAQDPCCARLSLIVTSRYEQDIRRAIEQIGSTMSLSNPLVDEDIRIYIENRIKADSQLNRWENALKAEIKDALINGAKGMFRWAACQLDILRTLHTRRDIEKALQELPETLEGIYERILVNISSFNRPIAKKMLQLVQTRHEYSLDALAEALAVDVEQRSFENQNRLLDPSSLLEICICLIKVDDEDGIVSLAHYTVAEYLASERCLSGPAATFKTSSLEADFLALMIFIVYLLKVPYEGLLTATEFFQLSSEAQDLEEDKVRAKYPLMLQSVLDWNPSLTTGPHTYDYLLAELIFTLLDPRNSHFGGWEEQRTIWSRDWAKYFKVKAAHGAHLSVTLAYLCFFNLHQYVTEYVTRHSGSSILDNWLEPDHTNLAEYGSDVQDAEGTPLQIAAMLNQAQTVMILLSYGADPNVRQGGFNVLTSTLRSQCSTDGPIEGSSSVVELLLQAGADANPQGVCKTPLQLAVECTHYPSVVRQLLAAGARVNAVGDPEAAISDMRERLSQATTARRDDWTVESYYDSPLKIAQRRMAGEACTKIEKERLAQMGDLLIEYGGISCSQRSQGERYEAVHTAFEKAGHGWAMAMNDERVQE